MNGNGSKRRVERQTSGGRSRNGRRTAAVEEVTARKRNSNRRLAIGPPAALKGGVGDKTCEGGGADGATDRRRKV